MTANPLHVSDLSARLADFLAYRGELIIGEGWQGPRDEIPWHGVLLCVHVKGDSIRSPCSVSITASSSDSASPWRHSSAARARPMTRRAGSRDTSSSVPS